MTEQHDEPVEVTQADAWRRLELWLFRECNEGTRRHLWSLFGLPVEEITNHGRERYALLYVKRCLATRPTPSSDMVEAMALWERSWAAYHEKYHPNDCDTRECDQAAATVIAEAMAAKDAALAQAGRTLMALDATMAAKDAELAERDARIRVLEEALEEIANLPGEINPSNYDHDDACELNRQFCYGGTIARAALGSAEG